MQDLEDPSLLMRCRPMQWDTFTDSPPEVLALASWEAGEEREEEDASCEEHESDEESTGLPPALQLPTCVWIDILKSHQLDFRDLKCFSRVCRRFNRLEKHPLLDSPLFRAPPPSRPPTGKRLLPVHPIFADLDMLDIDREDLAVDPPIPKWQGDDCNCDNPPHYLDYATSPACKVIDVHILDFRCRRAWGSGEGGGVTVGDVLHAVLFTWDEEYREKQLTREMALRKGCRLGRYGEDSGTPSR